jgi:large repetitive protein
VRRKILLLVAGALLALGVTNASARVLALPGNITAEATGPGGAGVQYTADGFACTPGSGATFPLGQTTVSCDDGTGAISTFTVTVVDTTPPAVTPPANVTVNTGNSRGTAVNYGAASATDAVAGSPAPSCSPASGSNFAVGTTTVTCSASDGVNTGTASFTVTVNFVDGTPPTVNVPRPITVEATGPRGAGATFSVTATDNVDPSPTVTCDRTSGQLFPLGTTTVTCTAKDATGNTSAPAGFTVSVVDRTPPVVTPPANVDVNTGDPSGTAVTYRPATATDLVAGSVTPICLPASGSNFPVGVTTVTCTASDGNLRGSATFTVTVHLVDTTPPALSVPSTITTEAVGPGGAAVTFSVTAADRIDLAPTVSCDHTSGQTFPLGATTVSCTARDASGNASRATFDVRVVDRGAPTVSVPGSITREATGPTGATAAFTVTAADAIDPSPSLSCTKSSGTTFPVGSTQVSCTAKDASNNTSAPAAFTVNIVDTTAPQLSNAPADVTAEANGPAGSKVNFPAPTAVDTVDGPLPIVACDPAPGSTFALGTKTVTCSATDLHGNTGTSSFRVKVVDTTPPVLIPPGDASVYATTDSGSYANDDGPILRFLRGAHASDIADPKPTAVADFPNFFAVGTTTVKFTATDASGNKASGTAKLTLLPKPAPGTTPPALPPPRENKPPASVTGLAVKSGDAKVTLTWRNPSDADFDHVEITRSSTTGFKVTGAVVYRGKATSFTDRGLKNDVEYRYVVASVDKLGNASAGLPIVAVPKQSLLRTPADGARLKKIPAKFTWTRDPRASYYNLQLYAGGTLLLQSATAARQKILSVFPTTTTYKFKSPWKWQGRKYTMTKGVYTWYVWPGYGPREDVSYGPLLGSATFQVTAAKSR